MLTCAVRAENYASVAPILDSAERFFVSLKERDYDTVWELLSEKSHKTIVNDIYRAARKVNSGIEKEDIIRDFNKRGVMFSNYWDSFLNTFDADMILEHSQWKMGIVGKDKAEIIITSKGAERPTTLKMFKEGNAWRVGLVETFWARKAVRFLRLIFREFHGYN